MKMYKMIYQLAMFRTKKALISEFDAEWTKKFYALSDHFFTEIVKKTPDIGNSIFSFNYAFAPAYIAWYKAAKKLEICPSKIEKLLWLFNEKTITTIPPFLRKAYGKIYLNSFRKKAPSHEERSLNGKLHPYDFLIHYIPGNDDEFEIDITRCGMRTLAADFDALGIFPTVCRVDYMIGHYLHSGFHRTKTLGDGNDCCNCCYKISGRTNWQPEKGFITER